MSVERHGAAADLEERLVFDRREVDAAARVRSMSTRRSGSATPVRRSKHQAVGDGEDRGVGADADGERERGGDREQRIAPEQARRVADVARERIEEGAGTDVADVLLHRLDAAQLDQPRPDAPPSAVMPARIFSSARISSVGAQLVVQLALDTMTHHDVSPETTDERKDVSYRSAIRARVSPCSYRMSIGKGECYHHPHEEHCRAVC